MVDYFSRYLIEIQPDIKNLLARLYGITGFVSVLGNDPRVSIFNRYNHVKRVVNVTHWLCDKFSTYDTVLSMIITLLHDINRLPFAHNLEKHIGYNQVNNLNDYFIYNKIIIDDTIVSGIISMLNKDENGPPESRLAYAADSVAGFIEDPLFAITTLNMPLTSISDSVANILGFDFNDKDFIDNLHFLKNLFKSDPNNFINIFDKMAFDFCIKFLIKHNRKNKLFVDLPEFYNIRQTIKYDFLRKYVFPINNEKVSLGTKIANEVALPLMKAIEMEGKDPILIFLQMTDQEVLNAAFIRNLIHDLSIYYPHLDYNN